MPNLRLLSKFYCFLGDLVAEFSFLCLRLANQFLL
jgi:hypothetical protein